MLRGREIVIIFFGILFCGLWLFFTQRVQQNQLASHERSIDLMMGSAEENLRKYFQMPLEVKGEDVSPPFSFLLSLNHETLEPKIFITNKELKSKLSAFSIKSAYKASGKKNNLFVYKSKRNNEDRTYLVRVIMTGNALRLEGMSLRNIQNALGYVFKDENWLFTDFENHILVGSGELNQKRLRAKELRSDYIAKPMVVENFRMKLYVKKNVSYSVTLANILGLFGIALMTFSLLNFRGESEDESLGASRGAYKNESETNPMSFEDGFEEEEEEMQVVRLENNTILNQQSIKANNKKPHTSASNPTPASNLASASSASASSSGSASSSSSEGRVNHLSRELDYGDFLMENPILGESPGELLGKSSGEKAFIEKRPEFLEEFLEEKESLLNSKKTGKIISGKTISGKTISSIEKKLIEKNEITPSVESIEDSIGENKTSSKHSSSTHSSNTHSNKYSSKQESVAISDEDEWLKLAEELTENLEEFAQNYKEFSSSSSSSSPSSSSSNDDDKTNTNLSTNSSTNSSTNLSTNLPTNSPTNLKG